MPLPAIPRGKFGGYRDLRYIRCPTGWKHEFPVMVCANCAHIPYFPSKLRWECLRRRYGRNSDGRSGSSGSTSPLVSDWSEGLDNLLQDLSLMEEDTLIEDVDESQKRGSQNETKETDERKESSKTERKESHNDNEKDSHNDENEESHNENEVEKVKVNLLENQQVKSKPKAQLQAQLKAQLKAQLEVQQRARQKAQRIARILHRHGFILSHSISTSSNFHSNNTTYTYTIS